jgi:hypothetical protein
VPLNYCACEYAESEWGCSYDGEMGCDCSTKKCPIRSPDRLNVPKLQSNAQLVT